MKRIQIFIFTFMFLIILFIPYYAGADRGLSVRPISPSGAEVKGNQWLFVIGIDTYIKWPRLKTAVNDAKSLKNVLLSRYFFKKGHLIELYDEQATRKNILGKLRFLAQKVTEDDSLLVFYAGHGHLDSITKEGSWIPIESGINDTSAWISNHDIKNYLKVDAIKAKHILLISDSCFAGDFFRGHRGKLPKVTETVIKRAYQLSSRQAITSGGLEPVSDAGFGNNSVFSYFLLKTLKENKKPFLVPSDLFPNIKAGVAENAEQFPRFGSLKGTGGQQGGELVLFLKQKSRLKDLSTDASKKSEELERLRQMEAEAREVKRKEEAEIAKREREIAELDVKIEEMKKRLGTAAANTDDSLDSMLAMVREKEKQKRHLDELKRKREAEKDRRKAEIARLKKEREEKRIAAIKVDIDKYIEIISSTFGKNLEAAAWKILADKYPEAKGLSIGDIVGLKIKIGLIEVIDKDGRFIVDGNMIVRDTQIGLEWVAGPDRDITWNEAKRWVESLNVVGTGWRMPTRAELKTLYKKGVGTRNMTPLLKTTGWYVWSGETKGSSSAWAFPFRYGYETWRDRDDSHNGRGFAVRSIEGISQQKTEETKKKEIVSISPEVSKPKVIDSDGSFIKYATGVVYDKKTRLEWVAGPDRDTTWYEAKRWVENLNVAGGEWRMPTRAELKILYKNAGDYNNRYKTTTNMTLLLRVNGWWVWSGETKGSSSAWYFRFDADNEQWSLRDVSSLVRSCAVRSRSIDINKEVVMDSSSTVKTDQSSLIAFTTGVVYDKKTGLEWVAGPDRNTSWDEAKRWVENLNVAGGGWRMPTIKELRTLYKKGAGSCNMTPLLKTKGWWVWSGETKGSSSARYFSFLIGNKNWDFRYFSRNVRGFAVRSL